MEKIFLNILNLSITTNYMIAAVILARFLLKKMPKSVCCFLWFLVGLRLVIPFSIESVFSLVPNQTAIEIKSEIENENPIYEFPQQDSPYIVNFPSPAPEHIADNQGNAQNQTTSYISIVSRIWAAGMALLALYLFISWYRLKNRVRTAIPCMYKDIKYYQCDNISSPFLFGFMNPKIYVPSGLSASSLGYVLKHELAHKHRKDYMIKPIGYLLLTVYWFNPFVWAAYLLLCRDIELACDERVIKELGTDCRKDYSQALLSCSVSRKTIAACPVAFGEVGVKQRIKNVLNYRKPTFWVLLAASMVCIIIVVCFMTQKTQDNINLGATNDSKMDSESEAKNSENASVSRILVELSPVFQIDLPEELYKMVTFEVLNDLEVVVQTADKNYGIGKLCVMPANDIIESMASNEYYLIGSYGANEILKEYYKTISDNTNIEVTPKKIPNITDIEAKPEGVIAIPNADGTESPELLPNAGSEYKTDFVGSGKKSGSTAPESSQFCYIFIPYGNWNIQDETELAKLTKLQNDFLAHLADIEITETVISRFDEYYTITNTALYIGNVEDAIEENSALMAITKEQIASCTDETKKSACEQLLKDLESKNEYLRKQLEKESGETYNFVKQWAEAFCSRDAEAIINMSVDGAAFMADELYLESGIDDKGKSYSTMGWSSPWPWGGKTDAGQPNYRIVELSDTVATILYYAWTSEPHVTVWRETIAYKTENGRRLVESEDIKWYDYIHTAEEFYDAYPEGIINGTMMDYYEYNAEAGEALNKNALLQPNLYSPDTAAAYLLNIEGAKATVRYHAADDTTAVVTFEFADSSTVSVMMIKPYSSNGIWLPQD